MIKKHKVKLIFSFFILLTLAPSFFSSLGNNAFAVTKDYEKQFKSSISSRRLKYKKFGLSMYKKDAITHQWKRVLVNNGNKKFIPASISKVLTGVGLLELHGTQKKIETKVFSIAKPKGKTLKGNLYIQGGGDPTLVSEKMWLLVNEIKKWGIKEIKGDLIFDDFVFDENTLAGGRTKWNQRAYNAALSGLALNWNSVRVRLLDGETLRVVTDPMSSYFDVRPKKAFKKSSAVEIRDSRNKEVLSVFYGKDALEKEKSIYRRVFHPRKNFERQFVEFLEEAGVKYSGRTSWSKTPEGLFELGKIESESMSRMVELMMKYSNNFIADMLTKVSHHEATKISGAYGGGLEILKSNFTKVHRFSNGLAYESASGLSRKNKFAPEDFVQFMMKLKDRVYFPELLSSLPLSCIDGTLKKRLCKIPGIVRAKTGLLAGVSTLAGFYRKGSEEYVFTFMYNGSNGDQFDARKTFDRFLESL